ncbi:MAG: S8 family serine peptidase [Gemmatimonadales bacterium]|nr:S8 family serine peptidase [Gemmatimonadales bacterium]
MNVLVRSTLLITAVALTACGDVPAPTVPAPLDGSSPSFSAQSGDAGRAIPGQYIVMFNNGVTDVPGLARQLAAAHGGKIGFTYQSAIKGFSVQLNATAAAAISRNPNVAVVEADQVMTTVATQSNATWGLDRSDQRALPLSTTYTYERTGAGVRTYIIDTGIRLSHSDFGGRATSGYDAVDGGSADDCNGHGTHVAGTVGGSLYGVAKNVALVAVRVLDCAGSGTTAGVIAGVDWVTANRVLPASANMSLGGGASSTLDAAVKNSIASGVSYAVAAGNGDFLGRQQDACNGSPSRVPEAITIGATDNTDKKASWSNYGNCVDFFAPGVNITSAWYQNDTQTNTISGTSMAAPHVAGAAALYLEANPGASPLTVRNALHDNTTKGIVTSSSTANNHLLYTLGFGGGGGTPNIPPTASFTFSCTDLSCAFTDGSADSDGSIASRSWTFGDGGTSTATNPAHSYAASGTYTVQLTVTDNGGATNSTSKSVTVTSGSTGGISLSATGYKVKGTQRVDLTWSGATSTNVDVFRGSSKIVTTANDGAYTDNIGAKGSGSYTYKICQAGTTTCSNSVTVTF